MVQDRKRKRESGRAGGQRLKQRRGIRRRPVPRRVPRERPRLSGPEVLYTVGMGNRQLQTLLQLLVDNGIELVVDVRPYAAESGPGFTGERDLAFLLRELASITYRREEVLLPPREMLEQYHRDRNWKRLEAVYLRMLEMAKAEEMLDRELYASARTCLLGDRESPEQDYRRLAAEYLREKWKITGISHL